jgi:HSF-type DNA-binding
MCVTNTAINNHVKADMPSNVDLASPKSAMPIKIDGRNVVPGLWPTDSEGQQYLAQVETEEDRNYRSPNALFPIKLHYMLEDVEQNGWEDIVSWAPHGRCFKIHNPRAFVARIMPKYVLVRNLRHTSPHYGSTL